MRSAHAGTRRVVALRLALAVGASVFIALRAPSGLDYANDAHPAIDALLDGDLAEAFAAQPLMGSFSVLLRLPFVAIANAVGGDALLAYRFGAFPCLLAAGLLGVYVAGLMGRRGRPSYQCTAVGGLVLVNPMTFNALQAGHPEEILAASLSVGAVVGALEAKTVWAVVLLGLALATKQWAVIAVIPTLLAAPSARRPLLLGGAAAVGLVLLAPFVLGDPSAFLQRNVLDAGSTSTVAYTFTVWRPFSEGGVGLPEWVGLISHPLIICLPVPLGYLYWRRRGSRRPEDILLLLALLFLLRAVLDPVNNGYYHLPFIVSLLVYEGLATRGLPRLTLLSLAVLWVDIHLVWTSGDYGLTNAVYLLWALPFAAYLLFMLYLPGVRRLPRRTLELARLRTHSRTSSREVTRSG